MSVTAGRGRVIVITGAMAAGKSTVAELLAARLPRSVHVRGDVFRRMVVNGRADMTPNPSPEARAQLSLRYDLAGQTADRYAAAGFDAIVQDVILGRGATRLHRPDHQSGTLPGGALAQLCRRCECAGTSTGRKAGYLHFSPDALDEVLRTETEQLGYWLDSSAQTPEETVDDILANLSRAAV